MPVFKGNVTVSVLSQQFQISAKITSISLTDRSGASNNVIVAIVQNGDQVYIRRMDISANQSYSEEVDILLPPGFEVLIIASASLDYYLTFD